MFSRFCFSWLFKDIWEQLSNWQLAIATASISFSQNRSTNRFIYIWISRYISEPDAFVKYSPALGSDWNPNQCNVSRIISHLWNLNPISAARSWAKKKLELWLCWQQVYLDEIKSEKTNIERATIILLACDYHDKTTNNKRLSAASNPSFAGSTPLGIITHAGIWKVPIERNNSCCDWPVLIKHLLWLVIFNRKPSHITLVNEEWQTRDLLSWHLLAKISSSCSREPMELALCVMVWTIFCCDCWLLASWNNYDVNAFIPWKTECFVAGLLFLLSTYIR